MTFTLALVTGLTTGGLSCLAVQGGLLTGLIANQKKDELGRTKVRKFDSGDVLPVSMFLAAKLVSHTILGFLLGFLGSKLSLSLGAQLAFQGVAAAFMLAAAANLLNLHPFFKFMTFQPPAWLARRVRRVGKSNQLYGPALLGLASVFIPCGVTQAMEVAAIASGNPVAGAAIMAGFVIGTAPVFGLVGIAVARLSEVVEQWFAKAAAVLLVGMALYSINGILLVMDSPVAWQNVYGMYQKVRQYEAGGGAPGGSVVRDGEVQRVTIGVESRGYNPRLVQVQQGVPVELTLESNGVYSCALAFVFREFGINTFLDSTDRQTFTFTPTKKGRFTYTCSMGMYSGVMEVI